MKKILTITLAVALFGIPKMLLANEDSCCMVSGAGGFTLSEEDKASLTSKPNESNPQTKQESHDSKSSQQSSASNKEN
ncbi:hypothetical protein [Helicobacter sp. MIT 05-5294]|uniref:hypothetical protein n=1 Tax=Helicobacter sp. MIT 05-5294 TaxID=1548150 RepID=UPI00051FC5A5|nr:hypothetical protein [Helicobacter sp. MIT 05-5294]TLD89103.1 hypothetical protein LS69_000225 [Helicobacter sp. MIT 05-5294]